MSYNAAYMREGREKGRNSNTMWSKEALAETLEGDPDHAARRLWWATKTGTWLVVKP